MKILHIIETLGRGGAENLLVNLLPVLQSRGHQCEVAVLMPPYDIAANLEEAGVVVHRLNLSHRWNAAQAITKIATLCRYGQYDILHAHLFFASIYTALSRLLAPAPRRVVLLHCVDYELYPANTLWKKVRKALHLWLMKNWIDGWQAVSQAVARHYESLLGVSAIVTIPNGVPVNTLRPIVDIDRSGILSKYGVSLKDFIFIMPCRLVEQKGHRFVFQALEILREKKLFPKVLIFGDGSLAKQIAEDVNNKNLQQQVKIHHALPHDELLSVVQSADAFLMASTHEGFPVAPTEAMALARPVLATRIGGLMDLVEDGISGLLVPPKDPVALAEGMAQFMVEPALRERLGKAGRQRIETYFSVDIVATKWDAYYKNIIKQSASTKRLMQEMKEPIN